MKAYVRSGRFSGTVYAYPAAGVFATHVEAGDRDLEGFFKIGVVSECRFSTSNPLIDFANTTYCLTTALLDRFPATRRP